MNHNLLDKSGMILKWERVIVIVTRYTSVRREYGRFTKGWKQEMKRNGDALSKFIVVVRYFLCPIFIRPVIQPQRPFECGE